MAASYWWDELPERVRHRVDYVSNDDVATALSLERTYPKIEALFGDVDRVADFFGMRIAWHVREEDCGYDTLMRMVTQAGPTIAMGRQDFLNWYDYRPRIVRTRVGHFVLFHTVTPDGFCIGDNPYEPIVDDRYFPLEELAAFPNINTDKGEDWTAGRRCLEEQYWDVFECRHLLLVRPA